MNPTRIRALDGWRGIAILLVIITHSTQWALAGPPFHLSYLLGKHGVGIFFVLSGYLITANLLSRPLSLTDFYSRRICRLMPSAWLFLAFACTVCLIKHEIPSPGAFLGSLFFFRNYTDGAGYLSRVFTGHFWSLSVEEQFYFVWPVLLALIGTRKALWAALAGYIASSIWVYRHWSFYATDMNGHLTGAITPCLICGCLTATLLHRPKIREWVRRYARLLFWSGLLVFLLHVLLAPMVLLSPLEALSIAAFLAASITRPARLLEIPPLTYVGRISYSLYVWQGFFLMPHAGWIGILLVLPAGALAYKYIETPMLRFTSDLLNRRKQLAPAIGDLEVGSVEGLRVVVQGDGRI